MQNPFSPAPVSTTARTARSAEASSSQVDDLVAHGGGDGVARLGPVEGDPRHPVLDPPEDGSGRPPVVRHQIRWMMFMRDVQTGSPVACSVQAVSTTMKVMVLPLDSLR